MCSKGRGLWLKRKMYLSHLFRKTAYHNMCWIQFIINYHKAFTVQKYDHLYNIVLDLKDRKCFPSSNIWLFVCWRSFSQDIHISGYNLTKLNVVLQRYDDNFFTISSEISNYVAIYVKLLWSPLFRFAKMVLGSVLLGSPRRNIRPKRR